MIVKVIDSFTKRFDILYAKRAFAYWFIGEGLESGEMSYAREEWACLRRDYMEVTADNLSNENGEDEEY